MQRYPVAALQLCIGVSRACPVVPGTRPGHLRGCPRNPKTQLYGNRVLVDVQSILNHADRLVELNVLVHRALLNAVQLVEAPLDAAARQRCIFNVGVDLLNDRRDSCNLVVLQHCFGVSGAGVGVPGTLPGDPDASTRHSKTLL